MVARIIDLGNLLAEVDRGKANEQKEKRRAEDKQRSSNAVNKQSRLKG